MTGAAVRAVNLTKRYGGVTAVDDLSFEIPAGETFGLIGPNGAGKTTTFSILATLLAPDAGRVEVAGADPAQDPVAVRRSMGYMPDALGVYEELLVSEYLEFFAAAYEIPSAKRGSLVDGLLSLVGLGVKKDSAVDALSRGMKQRLSLARALVHDPAVLILDEPASGLDARARIELRNVLADLRELGKTIVISSHILSELEQMCTLIAVMEAGRLLAAGTPREIRSKFAVGHTIRVRLAGGETREYVVADEQEQRELLHRLVVDEELPIVEFVEHGHKLEDLFMKITKGTVQ